MKKKILVVADTYFPKIDGIMRSMQEIIPRIANSFDITLIVPNLGAHWDYKEVLIKPSRIIKLSGYHSMALSISNIQKIRRAVQNADTIFVQGPALISILAVWFGKRYKKTVVHYMHLIMWELYEKHIPKWTRKIFISLFQKQIIKGYNTCDILIAPYKSLVEQMTELGITVKKEVVPLGVDSATFKPVKDKIEAKRKLGIEPEYTIVGYVGRISREKNVSVLCAAVQRLQEEHKILLLIVGSGTKHEVNRLPKVRNVMLPGFKRDVAPYYQAMDIFVMPSLTETTSLATLEAMSCGIPVITTKVGFLKEYVKKGYNGLLFPKGNTYTLMLQLRKLLRNRKLREQMGRNAQVTASRFSWDNTARRINEILQR